MRSPMPKTTGTVWLAPPPPPAVLTAMNIVMRPLLASPVGRRIKGLMLLEFTGRRSGRPIRVPVNFHLVDGVPMAFTDARWRLNFEGGAPVTVRHRGRIYRTHGSLVPMTPEEMGHAVRQSLDNGGSAQRMGIKTARGQDRKSTRLNSSHANI